MKQAKPPTRQGQGTLGSAMPSQGGEAFTRSYSTNLASSSSCFFLSWEVKDVPLTVSRPPAWDDEYGDISSNQDHPSSTWPHGKKPKWRVG